MRKTIILAKLKFVQDCCDRLSTKIYDDINRSAASFPIPQAEEYVEMLREIKGQASMWERNIDWMTEHEYECSVRHVFDRFNTLMSSIIPSERIEI